VPHTYDSDVLILGSGAAGLSLALQLPPSTAIAVLSKTLLNAGATYYAQGGISAVLDAYDSIEAHVEDTLNAGAGLCHEAVVRRVAAQGRASIQWLVRQGVDFTRHTTADGRSDYHLTQEGGHSHRRVLHVADATGQAVQGVLQRRAREQSNIALFENHIAIDLVTGRKLGLSTDRCLGAYVLDKASGHVRTFRARFTVLATGGAGKAYLYTSNPDVATGDGIAMAWRAGCAVANMEFMQFHPTCLYHPSAKSFLITEAIRGEGGRLLLPDGTPFMHKFDPRAELAPRDIVARAIDHEMKRTGSDCVFLDISHRPREFIETHFPTITAMCRKHDIDPSTAPIPVVPAAHYTCGGVRTDEWGRTSIPGLYAIGEVASTGLHGANRMASNSLLECLVFARWASRDIAHRLPAAPPLAAIPEWDESQVTDSDEEVVVSHNWEELRRFMWDYVGIVRTTKRLQRALNRVRLLSSEIAEYYGNFRVSNDLIELRNLVLVAELIIRSALGRKESRGLHYILDFPRPDDNRPAQDTVLAPTP
jgi:L-aspartate oxidase